MKKMSEKKIQKRMNFWHEEIQYQYNKLKELMFDESNSVIRASGFYENFLNENKEALREAKDHYAKFERMAR